jgi:RNA polymerase sigma-54 factor
LAETVSGEDVPGEVSDSFDEIDYGREFQDYLDPGYRTQEIEYKDDAPSFEQFLSHTESLSEHLEWQLNMLELSDRLMDVCVAVVGNLDADGRLTASIEELSGCAIAALRWSRKRAVSSWDLSRSDVEHLT